MTAPCRTAIACAIARPSPLPYGTAFRTSTSRNAIGNSIEVVGVSAPVPCLASAGKRASARPPPRRCASRAVRPAVRAGAGGGRRNSPGRCGGTAAHAERPRLVAGRRGGGRPHAQVMVSADGRGTRDAPRPTGAHVDGGLRGPACDSRAARVRRWVRIWSMTDDGVMNATMRMTPWQAGHASGSTSRICRRSAAHRRLASGGARRGAGTIASGTGAGLACRRIPRGRLARQP